MSNDITSRKGEVVGQWDGEDVNDLMKELARIKKELKGDRVEHTGVPHKDQFPEDFVGFTAYVMWAVDKKDQCLTGSGANRIEPVAQIREFYANDIAKDAAGRDCVCCIKSCRCNHASDTSLKFRV